MPNCPEESPARPIVHTTELDDDDCPGWRSGEEENSKFRSASLDDNLIRRFFGGDGADRLVGWWKAARDNSTWVVISISVLVIQWGMVSATIHQYK